MIEQIFDKQIKKIGENMCMRVFRQSYNKYAIVRVTTLENKEFIS